MITSSSFDRYKLAVKVLKYGFIVTLPCNTYFSYKNIIAENKDEPNKSLVMSLYTGFVKSVYWPVYIPLICAKKLDEIQNTK